jgi:hypothetical protein
LPCSLLIFLFVISVRLVKTAPRLCCTMWRKSWSEWKTSVMMTHSLNMCEQAWISWFFFVACIFIYFWNPHA